MSDIVERLRASLAYDTPARYPEMVTEAANEIERLRTALRASEELKSGYIEGHDKLAKRVGVLDAALCQFADESNWSDRVGCQQWMGKLDAVEFARSTLAKSV